MTSLAYRSPRGRWVVVATVLGSGMAMLDTTVVNVALPTIGRDFGSGLASLQWVVNGYAVTLAGLILLGGALGDRYGRRRVFMVGVAWFAAASLLCGLAWSAPVLIAARLLQGIGGALLTPGSLAILQSTFVAADRGAAIGAWTGLGGVASAAGPFLGGWLIEAVSWRLVFFINLPLAVAVLLIAARQVPESRDEQLAGGRVDASGAALAAAGLAGVTYGLIEGPGDGWGSPVVVTALVLGALVLGGFLLTERRRAHPLMPLGLFASRQFAAANVATFLLYAALGGMLFLVPVTLQGGSGYSPLASGIALLPVTAIMLVLAARFGALAGRIGPRLQMSVGPLVVAAGLLAMTRFDRGGAYVTQVLPAVLCIGLGLAITVAPLTAAVLAAAPVNEAGVASAVNNAVARSAGLVAVAVLPAAAGLTGSVYRRPDALLHGFRTAVILCAAGCVVAALVSAAAIRNPARVERTPLPAVPTEVG